MRRGTPGTQNTKRETRNAKRETREARHKKHDTRNTKHEASLRGVSEARFSRNPDHELRNTKLPGKGDLNSHGARPVHQIISLIKWTRTSRLSIKKSLSGRFAPPKLTLLLSAAILLAVPSGCSVRVQCHRAERGRVAESNAQKRLSPRMVLSNRAGWWQVRAAEADTRALGRDSARPD